MEKLTNVGLQAYHRQLSRKERVRLKNYVSMKFGISYFSTDGKFVGRQQFSPAELLALEPIIGNETWRQ